MTELLPATPDHLRRAAALLHAGQTVVFPTETVYGLGAHALRADGIAAVFAAKDRPADDPLIVHVSPAQLGGRPSQGLVDLGLAALDPALAALVDRLAAAFWPGPLTLLLPRGPAVLDAVTAGLGEVAVRVPVHPVALALLDAAGVPLVAPSANRFGRISPTTAEAALAELDGRVPLILDGGPCAIGVESTVLRPRPAQVLRPGAVTPDALARALGVAPALTDRGPTVHSQADRGPQPSPGLSERHYAPRTPLRAWAPTDAARVGALVWSGDGEVRAIRELGTRLTAVEVLAPDGQPATAAHRLYGALRRLDEAGCDVLLAEPIPGDDGLSLALRDRLRRACAPERT